MSNPKDYVRFAVACILCLGYPVLTYLSLDSAVSMSTPVIAGYVLLTALLLREFEAVTELVATWRGENR